MELLRRIESSLSQIVIRLHDVARETRDVGIAAGLRRIAHEVSLAATNVRALVRPEKKDEL